VNYLEKKAENAPVSRQGAEAQRNKGAKAQRVQRILGAEF